MLDTDEPVGILNPDTYLNHLSPADGFALEVRSNVRLFLLGAALWDLLAYLATDIRIVRGSRFSFNIFCFIFARLFALSHILLVTIDRVPTSPNVRYTLSGCSYMLSMMMSSFLFLQRVLAIYHGNKRVQRIFSIFWLVVALSDLVIPVAGNSNSVPGTEIVKSTGLDTSIVKDSGINTWVATCFWLSFSFDTAVVLAMSYKIWLSYTRLPGEHLTWFQRVSGGTLPQLPRLIFRGGLHYYLIIVGVTMTTAITTSLPSLSQIYKAMYPTILIVLMSSMTSRVFRNVRLFDSDNRSIEFPYSV